MSLLAILHLTERLEKMSAEFDALKNAVSALATESAATVTYIAGLAGAPAATDIVALTNQVAAVSAALSAAIAPPAAS